MEVDDRHWTDNPELIERFVLQRMNPAERNELEDHLRICEVCKKAVRLEQMTIAGIRRSGRGQFKARLQSRLASSPVHRTPWGHIISAAAIIVIITGIGVYNRWFESTQPVEMAPTAEPWATPEPKADRSEPAEQPASKVQEGGERAPSEPPAKPSQPKSESSRKEKDAPQPPATAGREPEFRQSGAAARATMDAVTHSGATEEIWLEGTILPVERGSEEAFRDESTVRIFGKKRGEAASGPAQHPLNENLLLSQQQAGDLPPTQQQRSDKAVVLAKAERIGNATQLTLYLDSLLDQAALANVRAETPDSNSLILYLPNQRIKYSLPAGWGSQLQVKQTK